MLRPSTTYNKAYIDWLHEEVLEQFKDDELRLKHVLGVVHRATAIAMHYHLDIYQVQAIAYLHDYTKNLSIDAHFQLISEEERHTFKEYPYFLHAISANEIARSYFEMDDKILLDAIYYHSTGRKNMTLFDKVLLIADMCEPGRTLWDNEALYQLALEDINKGLFQSIALKMNYMNKMKTKPHRFLQEAYEYYKEYA